MKTEENIQSVLKNIQQFCLENELGLAVAESVTGGCLQAMLCTVDKAGLFFEGGLTVYNCRQKSKILGLNMEDCLPNNGVSQLFAQQMALRTCELFGTELGISLTGFAAPIAEFNVKVPFAYGAVFFRGKEVFFDVFVAPDTDAAANRKFYAEQVLMGLSAFIRKQSSSPADQ